MIADKCLFFDVGFFIRKRCNLSASCAIPFQQFSRSCCISKTCFELAEMNRKYNVRDRLRAKCDSKSSEIGTDSEKKSLKELGFEANDLRIQRHLAYFLARSCPISKGDEVPPGCGTKKGKQSILTSFRVRTFKKTKI